MTTSLSAAGPTHRSAPRSRRATRAAGALGAAAAAAALWVLAVPVVGVDLLVTMNGQAQAVGLASVLGVSLTAGLLGWALLALLEWRVRRAAAIWTAVALVVTLLSLGGPLASATNAAAGAVLVGLHLVVAAVLIPALRRSSPVR